MLDFSTQSPLSLLDCATVHPDKTTEPRSSPINSTKTTSFFTRFTSAAFLTVLRNWTVFRYFVAVLSRLDYVATNLFSRNSAFIAITGCRIRFYGVLESMRRLGVDIAGLLFSDITARYDGAYANGERSAFRIQVVYSAFCYGPVAYQTLAGTSKIGF